MSIRHKLIANPELFRLFLHLVNELIIDLRRHENACSRFADLTLMIKCPEAGAVDCQIHIGVIQDDIR